MKLKLKLATIGVLASLSHSVIADQVISDDLIVQGNTCVGVDCVNGEVMDFKTLLLKQNNLRIFFDDTSGTGSFPYFDWQLTANESANGGANKFSIDDVTSSTTPFTVEGATPSHSLYLSSAGRLGLGTAAPGVDVHLSKGNTPTVRLDQNNSQGWGAYTWDVAANETNFFVRDVTNGSKLIFRIYPGAPSDSLTVASSGNLGLGVAAPQSPIHLRKALQTASPAIRIENTDAAVNRITGLEMNNAGASMITFTDTAAAESWHLRNYSSGDFALLNTEDSAREFSLSKSGNLTIKGNLIANGTTYTSSQRLKENFEQIAATELLDAVSNLVITKWNYISEGVSKKHIGPMAEQFHQLFGLNGTDDSSISVSDISGIALASIQALKTENDAKDRKIADLEQRLLKLEQLMLHSDK
ncbi:tail fiber domain-containing protein [Rheinheimera baltica]|uniref:Tail fiber domain-containing protein n=1 Tax=Rheinheimera baltica TaxID=67576 RepID=A0ABT9I4K7_9GAMM|nr:tail fiber domain-containing protein [Rheinheimera baltica]MDP5137881.1 tail fiber domain-containing protein [Rheinheimera baltica]MDP5149764.1 tail fiber domain-containing protein [Rheinheimera baltica]